LANITPNMRQLIPVLLLLLAFLSSQGQQTTGSVTLQTGQGVTVFVEVKKTIAQQAGGQAINFSASGSAQHQFNVTKIVGDTSHLEYLPGALKFQFDGMGQTRSFDSEKKSDLEGQYGLLLKEVLSNKFIMQIDPYGRVISSNIILPTIPQADVTIITDLLADLTEIVRHLQPEKTIFFHPSRTMKTGIGEGWTETESNDETKSETLYTVAARSDTAIVVDYKTTGTSTIKSVTMGTEARTVTNDVTTGKIIIHPKTGLIREQTSMKETNGNTEAMGGKVPITGRTLIAVTVKIAG
jgi:hypothetical protein